MNENDTQDVALENNDLIESGEEVSVEEQLKAEKTRVAELQKKLAIQQRYSKKEEKPKEPDTDYGLRAYLASSELAIKHEEDVALFDRVRAETGKKPHEIMASRYFQADLKEQRDTRESREAQPSRNNRSGSSSIDEASNWAAKINAGRATITDVPSDLRYEVIQKRIAGEQAWDVGASFMAKIAAKQAKR